MPYNLPNNQYPYPLNYLASDGGIVTETFVEGDPTVEPGSTNWFILCLTPEQMIQIKSLVDGGAPIVFPDSYQQMFYLFDQMFQFPNQIPENSCMDLCQLIIDCIDTTPELQQKIGQYAFTSSITDETAENAAILATDIFADQAPCDKDEIFGMCRQLANFLNDTSEDILELFVTAFAAPGRLGDIIEAIPVVGELPFDDLLQFLEKLAEQVNDAYQAAYDTQINEDIACLFFCEAQDDCTLTLEQARDLIQAQLVNTVENTDFVTIVNDIIANNWLGEQSIWLMHWFILDTIIFGGQILGQDINRFVTTIATFFNDPDPDWSTLCTSCGWTWVSDFDNDQNIWVASNNGFGDMADWNLGTGWDSEDVQVGASSYARIAAITTPEFTPTEINAVQLVYDLTKGSYTSGTVLAVSIIAVKDDDSLVRVNVQNAAASNGTDLILNLAVTEPDIKSIRCFVTSSTQSTASYSGSLKLKQLTVTGVGFNPFD